MKNPFSLEGETALITGGGTGIGFGIASCLAHSGARVILVGRRAEVLADAAKKIGPLATFEPHDITKTGEAQDFIKMVSQRVGPISILVNNAGVHLKKKAIDTTPAEFSGVLETHLVAAFSLTRAVLPSMIEKKHGNILFTASMASLFGIPLVCAYSAAKSAYLGLVCSLTTEVSPDGIRVNAIAPGWIESNMMRSALNGDPERSKKILSRTPLNCFGTPEDVGWAAAYLCSPAAKFITGQVLAVDGGVSIGF
jgi:NAD(P)-dependent dehydrogenase (short-subunit alcohol dehydrogenase family)